MLGLVAKPAEAMTGISKSLGAELSKSFEILFQPDKTGGEKWKDFILMILDMYQGVILASGAVNTALKHIFDPITGAANIVASLFMLEAAKAGVRSIKFAATGMDEIVTKPTMIIAGEAGAERVNVTPLNRTTAPAGGGGAGITVNISAPLVDETVVDSIIPAIKRAERMNLA